MLSNTALNFQFQKVDRLFSNPLSESFNGIIVHDGVCGMGKTNDIIDHINRIHEEAADHSVIYVTPFLSELHRIAGTEADTSKTKEGKPKDGSPPKRDEWGKVMYDPNKKVKEKFFHPQNHGNKKSGHLKRLIETDKNIVMTHSLFNNISIELFQLIKGKKYHLIIDEELPVLQLASKEYTPNITNKEVYTFIKNGTLMADPDTDVVTWDTKEGEMEYKRYGDIKRDCDNGRILLTYSKKDNSPILLVRQNPEIFKCFKTIHLLTYLFRESLIRTYFDLYKIPYYIKNRSNEERFNTDDENRKKIHPYHKLIHLYDTKGDWISNDKHPFCMGWYKKSIEEDGINLVNLKNRVSSFFKSNTPFETVKTGPSSRLWTTFKMAKDRLAGNGYSKAFIPFNTKSINDYRNVYKMAFLVDVHLPTPPIKNYLKQKGVDISELNYPLSCLIQWIFRGSLRNGEPVHLFIPSVRMRNILVRWINNTAKEYEDASDILNGRADHYLVQGPEEIEVVTNEMIIKYQPGLKHLDLKGAAY